MYPNRVKVVQSSVGESPQKKTEKMTDDIICLDDESDEGAFTKKIAITIEDPVRHQMLTLDDQQLKVKKSTKITIQIEDMDTHNLLDINSNRTVLISEPLPSTSRCHFTPLFNDFIQVCELLEPSPEMRQVIEKKLKHYFLKADESFKSSVEMEKLLSDKMIKLRTESNRMWIHIKNVVDVLKKHKKLVTAEGTMSTTDFPVNTEKASQITRLEQQLATLRNTICELEEQEVDFEQEDQSAYLRLEKCKGRLVETYSQLCALRKVQQMSYNPVELEKPYGRLRGPIVKLEEWVNKPVKSGGPPRFPDFADVVKCVKEASQQDQLLWSEQKILFEAQKLFPKCGRTLQRKRKRREWQIVTSGLTDWNDDYDPADSDANLEAALKQNRILASERFEEVFEEFEKKELMQRIHKQNATKHKSKRIDEQDAKQTDKEPPASEATTVESPPVKRVRPDLITEDAGADSDCCVLSDEDSESSDSSDASDRGSSCTRTPSREGDAALALSDDEDLELLTEPTYGSETSSSSSLLTNDAGLRT